MCASRPRARIRRRRPALIRRERHAYKDALSDGPVPRRARPRPMIWDALAACLGVKTAFGYVRYIPPGRRCKNPSRRGQNGSKEKI